VVQSGRRLLVIPFMALMSMVSVPAIAQDAATGAKAESPSTDATKSASESHEQYLQVELSIPRLGRSALLEWRYHLPK
jgi:hypothetical protein